jgi:Epoxide hydrolase N terminus
LVCIRLPTGGRLSDIAGHAPARQRKADQRWRGEDAQPADALTNEYIQRPPARGWHVRCYAPAGTSSVKIPLTTQDVVAPPSRTEIVMSSAAETAIDIHPFRVELPEEELAELRRRIEATRWPSKELVDDRSQGVQLTTLQELARYWTPITTGARLRRS